MGIINVIRCDPFRILLHIILFLERNRTKAGGKVFFGQVEGFFGLTCLACVLWKSNLEYGAKSRNLPMTARECLNYSILAFHLVLCTLPILG